MGRRKRSIPSSKRHHKTLTSCSFIGSFRETQSRRSGSTVSQTEIQWQKQAGRDAFAVRSSQKQCWITGCHLGPWIDSTPCFYNRTWGGEIRTVCPVLVLNSCIQQYQIHGALEWRLKSTVLLPASESDWNAGPDRRMFPEPASPDPFLQNVLIYFAAFF